MEIEIIMKFGFPTKIHIFPYYFHNYKDFEKNFQWTIISDKT
jgi:hypothetical protein